MIEERALLESIARSSQDECRQAGELFLALADRPRDVHFKAELRRRIDSLPPTPSGNLAEQMIEAHRRLAVQDKELWEAGWHPTQMLYALRAYGYAGAHDKQIPPKIEVLIELHCEWAGLRFGPTQEDIRLAQSRFNGKVPEAIGRSEL